MIIRKEDYKVDEVAFLLDLPSRAVLALCDAGVLACSRIVSNGAMKQRKKRHVSHGEVVRFNATRPAGRRTNIASRLIDVEAEQLSLPMIAQADAEPPDNTSVWLSPFEWRAVVAAITGLGAHAPVLNTVLEKIGPAGADVVAKGLKVRNYEGIAS